MTIKVVKNLVSSSKYSVKCPYEMDAEYITFHNTANDATAQNEISYMISNNNQVSYHFAVDDKEVVQGISTDRNAWHCGDGGSGKGNRKSIGVEVCYSKSGGDKYYKAEKLAIKFIAQLLHERGWGVDRVKKHQDWSGKYCPHRVLDEGRWGEVKKEIQKELDKLNGKKVVKVEEPKVKSTTTKKESKSKQTSSKKGDMKTTSIVTYLNSIDEDSSFSNRKKLAAKYGIKNYRGTASQNLSLLEKLRGSSSKPKKTSKGKSVSQMADEVIAGKHGSGHGNRRKSLGISKMEYEKVRNEVNRRAGVSTKDKPKSKPRKTITQMAKEVIDGKHGNGHESRRKSLGISKSEYEKVRAEVNRRL